MLRTVPHTVPRVGRSYEHFLRWQEQVEQVRGLEAAVQKLREGGLETSTCLRTPSCWQDHQVGGGVRIHLENARMSGRHGVQYVAQCVACAALTPVVWQ